MSELTRRAFLIGCSAAASPLVTPVSFAAAPWDMRLVVIVLRGGMDGLDVVRPFGDPGFAALRGTDGGADLDGFFGLHPALSPLMPLWQAGELGVWHAASTPYRDKRSHFDGQDLLEAGTPDLAGVRDGWLNRLLQLVPGVEARTAFALGHGDGRILLGPAPVSDWVPGADLEISAQAMRLAERVMEDDPAFHAALAEAQVLSEDTGNAFGGGRAAMRALREDLAQSTGRGGHLRLANYAAARLREETRIVSFSLNGLDTHSQQDRGLARSLVRLAEVIEALKTGVGVPVWQRTAVLAMTEFGRTVRFNGSGGTDHGTGGAVLMAGGALRGGQVYGQWPGLTEADLYARRDLMPTTDVRSPAAWVLRAMSGLSRSELERTVFPGLDLGADPKLIR